MKSVLIAFGTCVSLIASAHNVFSQQEVQSCDFSSPFCGPPPEPPKGGPHEPPTGPGGGGIHNLPGAPVFRETIIIPGKNGWNGLNMPSKQIEDLKSKLKENRLQIGP